MMISRASTDYDEIANDEDETRRKAVIPMILLTMKAGAAFLDLTRLLIKNHGSSEGSANNSPNIDFVSRT